MVFPENVIIYMLLPSTKTNIQFPVLHDIYVQILASSLALEIIIRQNVLVIRIHNNVNHKGVPMSELNECLAEYQEYFC